MISWGYIFSGILVLIIIGLICVILLENRNPHKALSWVLVLTLLPGLGVVLYLLFGREMCIRDRDIIALLYPNIGGFTSSIIELHLGMA